MRPVSDKYLRTIRGSHKMSARAYVLSEFQTGVMPTGIEIPIHGGDVTFDSTADVQGSLDLSTVFEFSQDGDLTPYGNEVFVQRIIHYGDASQEAISLGYYRIDVGSREPVNTGSVRVIGKDRMSRIVDERLPFPRAFPAGSLFEDIVTELVTDVYSDAVIEFDHTPGSLFIARTHVAERDRYSFIRDLATARGKVFYFDHRGVLVFKDPPDVSMPVFEVNTGEGGVLIEAGHEMSREQVYNGVVAFGEGTDMNPPVSALVVDSNLNSKTYWHGQFGKVVRFFFSSFLTNESQCISAATKILSDALGLPYKIDFTMAPNHALEVRDPVSISSPGESTRVQAIETLRMPLLAGQPLRATAKEKSTEQFEVIE